MEVARARKILFVITKPNWGGAQRYVYDVATAAKNKGFMVIVATGTEGELTKKLRESGVRTELVSALARDVNAASDVRALRQLYDLMRREHPDVVHLNSSKAGAVGALAARLAHVPRIIFTAHGWAFNEPRPQWHKYVFGLLHHVTILLSHVTICNSRSTYDDVAHLSGVKKKLVVIHNGVRPAVLASRADARAKLALNLDYPFWLGTLSELHRVKGLPIALEAFAKVAKQFPDTALVIIGNGEERAGLEKLVKELDVAERVHFCGHVENASSYLSAFDIFLLPSLSESFGYVVLEAGLASLPVIASRVGGIPEILTNEESGILIPPGNVPVLAEALVKLVSNTAERVRLGANLKERVKKDFSLEMMLERTLALYTK